MPGAVADRCNFFNNKTHFDVSKPNMVNITFGIQATRSSTKKASRCFNWTSVGYFNEFLKYRKVKDASGVAVNEDWSDPVYSMTEDSTNVISGKDWI